MIFQGKAGQPFAHGLRLVQRDVGPARGGIGGTQFDGRFRVPGRPDVHVAAIRTFDIQLRGDPAAVVDLHQKQAGAGFDEFGFGGALLDFHAALRVDVDNQQRVLIEGRFDFGDGGGLVRIGDGVVDGAVIGGRERLSQVGQRRLDLAHILRQRLQRHFGRGVAMFVSRRLSGDQAAGETEDAEARNRSTEPPEVDIGYRSADGEAMVADTIANYGTNGNFVDRRGFLKATTAAGMLLAPAGQASAAPLTEQQKLDRIASNTWPIRFIFKTRSTRPNPTAEAMKKKYGEITMLDFPRFTKETFPGVRRMDLFSGLFGDFTDDSMYTATDGDL